MKTAPGEIFEKGRVKDGLWASDSTFGINGMFRVTYPPTGRTVHILASNGGGWEHVSISIEGANRCPTWEEMSWVKDQFWRSDEWVIQFHPAAEDYVNCHPYVLHLWAPLGVDFPHPPAEYVGPKSRRRH